MTTFSNSPRLLEGGIVLINSDTSVVWRTITRRYNSVMRTLQARAVYGELGA